MRAFSFLDCLVAMIIVSFGCVAVIRFQQSAQKSLIQTQKREVALNIAHFASSLPASDLIGLDGQAFDFFGIPVDEGVFQIEVETSSSNLIRVHYKNERNEVESIIVYGVLP